MQAQSAYGGWEHEEQNTNNPVTGDKENCVGDTVEAEPSGKKDKKGKSKRATTRKRKTTSEEEPNKSSEDPKQKKFKHSSRRQKRTCNQLHKILYR